MKKLYFFVILFGFILGFFIPCFYYANASILLTGYNGSPEVSTPTLDDNINVRCSVGDSITIWQHNGKYVDEVCDSGGSFNFSANDYGLTYGLADFVECNTASVDGCARSRISKLRSSDGYVSELSFSFQGDYQQAYDVLYLILTSFLPQLLIMIFFPLLVVGIMFNFMKNPLY